MDVKRVLLRYVWTASIAEFVGCEILRRELRDSVSLALTVIVARLVVGAHITAD
jgi:hypothetical protein